MCADTEARFTRIETTLERLADAQLRGELNAFLSVSEWVKIYSSWRPNLRDEADNHLVELAVAGAEDRIVTYNHRHLSRAELQFPGIRIVSPARLMEELR